MSGWLRGAKRTLAGLKPLRVPEAPARAFRDLWPGDAARGQRLLKGEFEVLGTTGHFNSMAIAFRNPDGTVVVVVQNALDEERPFAFADPDAAERGFKVTLAPRSFNTFVLD